MDAEAICEAVSRPNIRFVPVKSADQQAVLMLHRTRALLIRQQTMLANAFRAHLAEFGIVVAQGIRHTRALIEKVFGEDTSFIGAESSVPLTLGQGTFVWTICQRDQRSDTTKFANRLASNFECLA